MVTRKSNPKDVIDHFFPKLNYFIDIYKDIHQHPELGTQESRTASIVSDHLEKLGYIVHRNVGGHGVVGVWGNGPGKTVLLRADMDALPVKEETGLPYSSNVRATDPDGNETPVMHACGHDMHTTSLMAIATLMRDAKTQWSGTLICLFQPDEERFGGAQVMVDDGLYQKVPIPDVILGQHIDNRRAGNIAIRSGVFMAAADAFLVKIIGRGGHGSQPQLSIDPIAIAAYTVVRLQSIVSRFVAPTDTAVVTCGSIHGGSVANVIPDEVEIKLDIRSYKESVRERIVDAARNIVSSECKASKAEHDPIFKRLWRAPVTDNDPKIADSVASWFREYFGDDRIEEIELLPGSEDFANLALPNETPYAYWFLGGTDKKRWDEAKKNGKTNEIPRPHSSKFAPVIESTMTTSIQGLSLAALNFLL